MANEQDFGMPNPESSQFNYDGEPEKSHEPADAIEKEWQQITAAYTNQELLPEWENPDAYILEHPIPLPIQDKENQVSQVKRLITYCRRNARPIAWEILSETNPEGWEFNPNAAIEKLVAEFEHVLQSSEAEASEIERKVLGSHEFEAELGATDQAHELALTEILAAESAHAEMESEAQSLLATALPITLSVMGDGPSFKRILPSLTRANAKLTSALFQGDKLSREALSLVPSIQRRVISSLQSAEVANQTLNNDLIHRLVAAQTAKILGSPNVIGRAMIRNRAIRMNTMSSCP